MQLKITKNSFSPLIILLFFLLSFQPLLWRTCTATHVVGTFYTDDFLKFIVKFGFQKAESHSQRDSFGYIYGNITSQDSFGIGGLVATLVVLDKPTFVNFYSNRSKYNRDLTCQRMFAHLQLIAYDVECNAQAKHDFLRRVPCPRGQLCPDEDNAGNVVPRNQFTYVISVTAQPRFWYVALVACYRDRTTCRWQAYEPHQQWRSTGSSSSGGIFNANETVFFPKTRSVSSHFLPIHSIDYDIRLVNGNPNISLAYPLTFEFSFDQQNLLEMYLIFFLVYIVLLPVQCYAVRLQKHPVTKLFTLSLLSEFISLALITVHLMRFALNGVGEPKMQSAGDILDIFSRTTFMLILLLLAKGWAVTRQQISRTGWIILMTIWMPYCAFHVFLYIWDRTEVDIVSDVDEYQTWPGWIVLILRTSFMLWFLYELRNTMKYEHSTKKLDFLLHLGASSLVWFIYLPIVAIVALQVSPMWRYKLLLGITNSADCLAYCVMTGLLWPNRSGQYLLLAGTKYSGMDELDEFNEAPHIVRERERRRNSLDNISINGNIVVGNSASGGGTGSHGDCGVTHGVRIDGIGRNSAKSAGARTAGGIIVSASIPYFRNGEAGGELLEAEDLRAEFLTDLNKNSHIIA